MQTIRCAIVEDDIEYTKSLQSYIERFQQETKYTFLLRFYEDGEDIVENYIPQFDIILLDIQMRFMDGMTAAHRIRELDDKVLILFITNMTSFAIQAFEVEAFDYILKPLSYQMFSKKLMRAVRRVSRSEGHSIMLKTRDGMRSLNVKDIFYVESVGHMLEFHMPDTVHEVRGKIEEMAEKLSPMGFIRINRGSLVNIYHISALYGDHCIVHGDNLPVSRSRKADLVAKLSEML